MGDSDSCLLLDILDINREGFRHIGERIALYLDYHSLASFKRTCSSVYQFLGSCDVEHKVIKRKLKKEWSHGEPKTSQFGTNYFSHQTPVKCVKLLKDKPEILVSTVKSIYSHSLDQTTNTENCDVIEDDSNDASEANDSSDNKVFGNVVNGMKLGLNFPSTSLNAKISSATKSEKQESQHYNKVYSNNAENLEKNQITEFDVLDGYLVSGNNNGILSIWDLETCELLNSKQLFGIITGKLCPSFVVFHH